MMIMDGDIERTEGKTMAGQKSSEDVVFIGIKPVMNYVLAAVSYTHLTLPTKRIV